MRLYRTAEPSYKMRKLGHCASLSVFEASPRKVVCRRCGRVLANGEPASSVGEFYHPLTIKCQNGRPRYSGSVVGRLLTMKDSKEIEPFRRKRERTRRAKRARAGR